MTPWLALPFEARLGLVWLVGVAAGAAINLAAYRLAWNVRHFSPWLRPPEHPATPWTSRLPVLGWWFLRHESRTHGRAHWVRPLLIELGTGLGLAALYYWETEALGLVTQNVAGLPELALRTHAQFVAHALLVVLMLAASLIDLDEKTIPDGITVPGTLMGLALAVLLPGSRLPEWMALPDGKLALGSLHLLSPQPWPASLAGAPQWLGWAVGVGCFWGWCLAILPRVWRPRRGWRWALAIFVARIARDPFSWLVGGLAATGPAAIALGWWQGGPRWEALLTALVGLAASGGLVWAVRLIGAAVLRREAMGFGDVTLMAMIGAFLGWQPGLIVFFLSPFCGIILGGLQWILSRDPEIPFGPFLCLAALVVIVRWPAWWQWVEAVFGLGAAVPVVVLGCLALLGLLLGLLRLVRGA